MESSDPYLPLTQNVYFFETFRSSVFLYVIATGRYRPIAGEMLILNDVVEFGCIS